MQKHHITITYCYKCNWLLRSSWICQELLSTFAEELPQLSLCPTNVAGTFTITVNGQLIWDRKQQGGFPEIKTLKQIVRDHIAPDKGLGHNEP